MVPAMAEDVSSDPKYIFAKGNALYERRDYEKALEEYNKIIDQGIASGPIYYNMANSYFKLGKIGYAILYYKKALRLSPADSELKSNLGYAQSLTEDSGLQAQAANKFVWVVKIPFKEFTLNGVGRILAALYLVIVALLVGGIVNHTFKRRATLIFYPLLILFILALAGFSVRYYEEEALTRGVVVAKESECKYEPIDKSTTYFTLKNGQEVQILKSRNGWSRIKRLDGKLGWIRSDTVEEE
jgi:tetratricopeptide (TPR) repeat protein